MTSFEPSIRISTACYEFLAISSLVVHFLDLSIVLKVVKGDGEASAGLDHALFRSSISNLMPRSSFLFLAILLTCLSKLYSS